jgi:hypothetical protein
MKSLCDKPSPHLPSLIKIYGNERRAMESDASLVCVDRIFGSDVEGISI